MKLLLLLLLLFSAGLIHAQKRIIFIEPGKETSIHVNRGDSFMIQSIMTAPRGKKALPYMGRALGAGLLTYGAERVVQTVPGSKETSGQSEGKSLWPAIGAGVNVQIRIIILEIIYINYEQFQFYFNYPCLAGDKFY